MVRIITVKFFQKKNEIVGKTSRNFDEVLKSIPYKQRNKIMFLEAVLVSASDEALQPNIS